MRIWDDSDPGWKKNRTQDKHPGSATLTYMMFLKYLYNLQQYNRILEESTTTKRHRVTGYGPWPPVADQEDRIGINKKNCFEDGFARTNCCSRTAGSAWRGWVAPRRRVSGRRWRDGGSSPPRAALSRSPDPCQPARVIVYHAPRSSQLLITSVLQSRFTESGYGSRLCGIQFQSASRFCWI